MKQTNKHKQTAMTTYEINETTGFIRKEKSGYRVSVMRVNMPKRFANKDAVTHIAFTKTIKEAKQLIDNISCAY